MNLSAFEHLIFDYDNTIARFLLIGKWRELILESFLPKNFKELSLSKISESMKWKVLPLTCIPIKKMRFFSFRYLLEKSLDGRHEPIIEVIALLRKYEQGPFHIISNNLKSTVCSGLSQFKIRHLFDIIIGVDEAECPKPSTKAWDILLSSKKINHKSCLFIGDSKATDEKFAQRVGIPFINVSNFIMLKNE